MSARDLIRHCLAPGVAGRTAARKSSSPPTKNSGRPLPPPHDTGGGHGLKRLTATETADCNSVQVRLSVPAMGTRAAHSACTPGTLNEGGGQPLVDSQILCAHGTVITQEAANTGA